eukprot:16331293-Heterocapsa_arctica.AAC.1
MMGFDPLCGHCGQQGLVFGWQQLKVYDKDKDNIARGFRPNVHAEFYDGPAPAQDLPVPEIYGEGTAA